MIAGLISDYGTLFGGIAALLTAALAVVRYWIKDSEKRVETNLDEKFFAMLREMLTAAAERAGPAKTRVVDVEFVDPAFSLRFPVIRDTWLSVLPGCDIMGDEFARDRTTYFLRCANTARIRPHRHKGGESVLVISGRMIDLDTGKIYLPGDTWSIAAGEIHSVHFEAPHPLGSHGIYLITVRPPLPDTTQATLDLAAIEQIAV